MNSERLPPMIRGDEIWCQPHSDLLAGKTAFVAGSAAASTWVSLTRRGIPREGVGCRSQFGERARRDRPRRAGDSADVRAYAVIRAAMEGAAGQLDAFDIVVSGAAGNVLTPALDILVKSVVDIGLLGIAIAAGAGAAMARAAGSCPAEP